MNDAERLIAFGEFLHDHSESENVGELLEAEGFALHLAPYRVGAFAATGNIGRYPAFRELARELLRDLGHQSRVLDLESVEPLAHYRVRLGIELAERQILELFAHLVHAHTSGERRIDIERLLGTAPARFRRHVCERAHVVQAVGELDQQDPDVVCNRQQEPAQVFGLFGLLGDQVELLELGEAFDQRTDVAAEHLVDFGPGRSRVLDRIVQQRCGDRGVVELEIG